MVRLANSEDQIVVIVGSAFDQKTWACCKSTDSTARELAQTFVTLIRQNSDRCRLVSAEAAAVLPDDLATSIKLGDQYLIRAQLTVPGATLVTTDGPLRDAARLAGLACLSREEFLGAAGAG